MANPHARPLHLVTLARRSTTHASRACPRFATRPRQLLALAALALAAAVPGAAATTVPGGTIATSTTWSLAGSPYVVQGTVTVGAGTTLTVAAGVQVRFAIGTQLDVVDGGSLVAQGSAGQPVAFTSDVASPGRGDWYYIRAFAGARLRLTHCEIAWAGRGGYSALVVYATDTEIRNCRVHDNAGRAIHLEGAGLAPLLADTQIQNNGEIAVYQTTVDMTPTYQGVSMSGNGTDAVVIPGGTVHRAVTIDGSAAALSGASPLISGSITVAGNGALAVTPGTTLRFATSTQLDILDGGRLTAQGKPTMKIAFTSAAAPQQRGDWYYVRAFTGAHVSLSHFDLAYAGRGGYSALIVYATDTTIADSRIHDNASTAVQLEGAGLTPSLADTRIDHNGGNALYQGTINMAPVLHNLTFDGNATDALVIAAPNVTTDVTLDGAADVLNGAPVVLTASLAVQSGGRLTIAPGTTIAGPAAYQIDVIAGGTLLAEGTAAEPIVLGPAGEAPAAGFWYYLRAFAGSTLRLAHADLGYAGRGNYPSLWVMTSDAEVRDCRIHHGASTGVQLDGAGLNPILADLAIEHNGGVALYQTTINMAPALSNLALTANGSDALLIASPTVTSIVVIDGSADILNGAPIRLNAGLAVQAGASLTVVPGTTLRLPVTGSIDVIGGTLLAEGTTAEPIVVVPDTAVPAPGDLYYLRAFAGATLRLAHFDLGYAGRGNYPSLWVMTSDAEVRDSRIHHGASTGVQLDGAGLTPVLASVTVDHNGGAALYQTTINMAPSLANLNLSDNGRDILMMPGGTVDRAVTLDGSAATIGGKPVVLTGSLTVGAAGALTIAAGTTVRLPMAADFVVAGGGTLFGDGSAAAPVVLVSDAATPQPGDWYRLLAQPGSHLKLNNVDLSAAGRGNYPALQLQSTDVALANCRLHANAWDGIQTANEAYPRMTANQVRGNGFGVRNNSTTNWVDARFTWWGDASGPYHATLNPGGKGNAVSDRVQFEPWAADEEGTLSSAYVVQLRGPNRVTPGATVDYSVYYATYVDLDDAVLAVTLPFTADYLPRSADGIYHPGLRQVFWRLGNLAAGTEGELPLKVRYGWGIRDGLEDELEGYLFGANQGNANESVDLTPYTEFTPLTPTGRRTLARAEVDAAIAASPPLKTFVDAAVASNYMLLGGADIALSNGDAFLELVLIDKGRHGAMWLRRRHANGAVIKSSVTPTEYTLADATGGLVATVPDGPMAFWGSWADAAAGSAVQAKATATMAWCMRNCTSKSFGLYVLGKVSKRIDQAMQIRDCYLAVTSQGGDSDAVANCVINLGGIAVEEIAMVKDEVQLLYPCVVDCSANVMSHICAQSVIVPNPSPQQRSWLAPLFEDPARTYTFYRCDPETRILADGVTQACPLGYAPVGGGYWNANIKPPGPCVEVGLERAISDLYKDIAQRQRVGLRILGYGRCRNTVRVARDPNAKYGPAGDVLAGERLSYTVTCENEGAGEAYGVFIMDQLHENLDESTLDLGGSGTWIPAARSILWDIGELAPKGQAGSTGSVSFTVAARADLPPGTVIPNRAVVYFPSVPEETPSNFVINTVAALAARPQTVETSHATPLGITLQGAPGSAAPFVYTITRRPSFGRLTGTPPDVTYAPDTGFVGDDHFSFGVTSGAQASASAEVAITVAPPANDTTRPRVTWVWPAAGETVSNLGVRPVGSDDEGPMFSPFVQVELSEVLAAATVTADSVHVFDANRHQVPVGVTFDTATRRLALAVRERWRATTYTVTVTTDVADLAGNHLAAPYTWSFTANPPGWIRERLHSLP